MNTLLKFNKQANKQKSPVYDNKNINSKQLIINRRYYKYIQS